jgi:RHS repeat-associated protein
VLEKSRDTLVSTYTYDANGNRIAPITPNTADSGAYDAQDRMLSYGNAQFVYLKNGELQKKIVGSDTTCYTYDYFGNLMNIRLPNGDLIEYMIDAQNHRIGKKINGNVIKRWAYVGGLLPIAELDSAGNVTAQFVGNLMLKNGNTYQLITDHLGSVRLVVNVSDGTIAQQLDYDEYGNITQNTNPDFQPFAYAGGLYDSQTKLVRFGARDYDAISGRWTCKDPIGFKGHLSNLYEYVLNDPVNLFDKNGYQIVYGQETPSNIIMSFNGSNLSTRTVVGGTEIITGNYSAVSGPYGNGALPEGVYTVSNLRSRTAKGMVCPGETEGYSLDLNPEFETDRTDLRIHPDEPPPGTMGCIGIDCSVSKDFRDQVSEYFTPLSPTVYLYVHY